MHVGHSNIRIEFVHKLKNYTNSRESEGEWAGMGAEYFQSIYIINTRRESIQISIRKYSSL